MAQSSPAYCSLFAQAEGFDPIGTASPYEDLILVELPLPWAYRIWESSHIPPDLAEYVMAEAKARNYRLRVLFIAPEAEYSQPGMVRVMHMQRPAGRVSRFKRAEFLLPPAEMPALVRALCADPTRLDAWEEYRQDVEGVRDLMVCTHGAVDVVCAKFGYPTYKMLRTQYANEKVRVWRVSHFGGHICAPTMLTFPDGRAWAYINAEQAPQLVLHSGEPRDLYGNYRGWATLSHRLAQVVEREVWMHEGWAWLDCAVDVEMLAVDEPAEEGEKPAWGEVKLHYERPDGRCGSYYGRVELSRTLKLFGSTKNDHPYPFAQYQVTALEHLADPIGTDTGIDAATEIEAAAQLQLEGTLI